jgi:hypothetical protein
MTPRVSRFLRAPKTHVIQEVNVVFRELTVWEMKDVAGGQGGSQAICCGPSSGVEGAAGLSGPTESLAGGVTGTTADEACNSSPSACYGD